MKNNEEAYEEWPLFEGEEKTKNASLWCDNKSLA